MPIPKPRSSESKSDYISRAVRFLIEEGRDSEQAVAIANSEWEKEHGKVKMFDDPDYKTHLI